MLEVDELAALRAKVTDDADPRAGRRDFATDVRRAAATARTDELERAARTTRRPRPSRRAARARLARLLLHGRRQPGERGRDQLDHPRQLAAHRARHPGGRRVRGQERPGDEDPRHASASAASFTEYYAMDFNDDVVLMGHDGPGHIAIAQGKTKVRPLKVYHGKVGRGLRVEMSVKHGPVTLLSRRQSGRRLAEAAGGGRRERCPGRSWRSATRTAVTGFRSARGGSSTSGTATAPRTTARSASGTLRTGSGSSGSC